MDEEVDPGAKTTLICDWGLIVVGLPDESNRLTPNCELALVAARKMSCCRAPCGTTEGEMPLKVMLPAWTTVTAACAARELSTLEQARTVTIPAAVTGAAVEDGGTPGPYARA